MGTPLARLKRKAKTINAKCETSCYESGSNPYRSVYCVGTMPPPVPASVRSPTSEIVLNQPMSPISVNSLTIEPTCLSLLFIRHCRICADKRFSRRGARVQNRGLSGSSGRQRSAVPCQCPPPVRHWVSSGGSTSSLATAPIPVFFWPVDDTDRVARQAPAQSGNEAEPKTD